jgi:pentatricopeptide repeat protein
MTLPTGSWLDARCASYIHSRVSILKFFNTPVICSILFTALGKVGEVKEVKELYRSAKIKFDSATVNSLLKAYSNSPEPLAGESLLIYT